MAYTNTEDLEHMIESINLAKGMKEDLLNKIGQKVVEEFNIDDESRTEWLARSKTAMKLTTNMLDNFSGDKEEYEAINFPLLLTASVSFAARAYTQLIQPGNIVKGRVIGRDDDHQKADRAKRVSTHMNYQLTEQMTEWEDETDSLLMSLPVEGCEFKKTAFNSADGVNVSEWIRPADLVINYKAKNLEKAPRYTHIIKLYPNEIIERIRSGVFLDIPEIKEMASNNDTEEGSDTSRDDDAPHIFYEQARYWDLDDDGYKEPYIMTVHKGSEKVVRIMARFDVDGVKMNEKGQIVRIKPVHYVTRFLFMPSPDGGVYGMGYGNMIGPINLSTNAALNDILEAGYLANTQGGFTGKGVSFKKGGGGGDLTFSHGEFKSVNHTGDDIRKAIMPLPFAGPSMSLFHIADRLINAGEKLGSITDPIMGESPGADIPATTTLALIEQGSKIPSSVYLRLHKAFKSEFKKLFRLNRIYLEDEEYFTINDEQESVAKSDYDSESCDIVPVSNPAEISNTHKLLSGQALMQFLGMGLNDDEIIKRNLEAMQITDIDKILPQEGAQKPPDPKTILELQKLELERDKYELTLFKAEFEVAKLQADTIKSLAQAEGVEVGEQIQIYTAQLQAITQQMSMRAKKNESTNKGTGGNVAS